MRKLFELIKGCIIGVACVVPGLSGGTLAISMGIYEDIIYSINNFTKTPKECIKKMWLYGIGMLVGVLIAIISISTLFEFAPVAISMLFVGLVLGAIPDMTKELDENTINLKDFITFTVFASLIIFLPTLTNGVAKDIVASASGIGIMTMLGALLAATIIIPGVSGSVIFMALGYYKGLMDMASNTVKDILKLDFTSAWHGGMMLIPLAIGAIVGIILLAKLLEKLLKEQRKTVYWGILGIVVASPFPIILALDLTSLTAISAIASTLALAVGICITIFISKEDM